MSADYPTLDSLAALGFERRASFSGMEAVGYRFRHLDLTASASTTMLGASAVLFSGILSTKRRLGEIDHLIAPDIETPEEAAAWVAHVLHAYRSDLGPLPTWFLEGERHWEVMRPALLKLAVPERSRAYENRPKCFIDREYARPLRHQLRALLSKIAGEVTMTVSFDGRILSFTLCGTDYEVIASGDRWPSAYRVTVCQGTAMAARFPFSTVAVSVFEGFLIFGNRRLGACEAIA